MIVLCKSHVSLCYLVTQCTIAHNNEHEWDRTFEYQKQQIEKQEAAAAEEAELQAKDEVRQRRLLLAMGQETVKTKQPLKSNFIQGV